MYHVVSYFYKIRKWKKWKNGNKNAECRRLILEIITDVWMINDVSIRLSNSRNNQSNSRNKNQKSKNNFPENLESKKNRV